jgi:uncharacterized protein (DUF1778 family)
MRVTRIFQQRIEGGMARATARRERLEARVTKEQKDLFQRAADLTGSTLTDFVVRSLEAAAEEIIEEREVIKLSPRDSMLFVEALLNPPEPSEHLREAFQKYREFVSDTE